MAKAKYKLRFKPTPISRLRHYRYPLKMVGDPQWSGYGPKAWLNREKAVYAYEMDRKADDRWHLIDQAERDNTAWDYHNDNYIAA